MSVITADFSAQNPFTILMIGDRLCMEDNVHDGEWGQYLKGCVLLESLFGVSCIGNPLPCRSPRIR